jgi:hypothetical protein
MLNVVILSVVSPSNLYQNKPNFSSTSVDKDTYYWDTKLTYANIAYLKF